MLHLQSQEDIWLKCSEHMKHHPARDDGDRMTVFYGYPYGTYFGGRRRNFASHHSLHDIQVCLLVRYMLSPRGASTRGTPTLLTLLRGTMTTHCSKFCSLGRRISSWCSKFLVK